jgi:hypothetical protein
MSRVKYAALAAATLCLALVSLARAQQGRGNRNGQPSKADRVIEQNANAMLEEGRRIFRFETFGDQAFWGDSLKLHQAIEGSKLGGAGAGVSPATALSVGLKVDVDALPGSLQSDIAAGKVHLDDPAVTLSLLQLNAVVGVTGFLNSSGGFQSVGIQCALCHSTVDDSFAPGIGHRLDGWANRDLNVGAIIGLAPDLGSVATRLGVDEATVRTVLASWGPGRFDAQLFLDGKAFRPDGKTAAALIPPAFGLAGVNMGTSTGFGSTTYWNAFVANLEMHGSGTFFDPRLADPLQFPVAARNGSNNVRNSISTTGSPDFITSKLAALHFYQLAIPAPTTPAVDNAAAARGEGLFNGKAQCARCHVAPLFTEPGFNMHTPAEIGIDDFQANRSPTKMYRTSPLRGLMTHQKGGFYHDGRFATLQAVVDHYDSLLGATLSASEEADLIAYLQGL